VYNNPTPLPTQNENPPVSDNGSDKTMTDGDGINFISPSVTQEERDMAGYILRIDEQNGDVFIIWENPKTRCDTIEILRCTRFDGGYIEVIASFPDNNPEKHQMYIDKGAAGKGYYYAVRGKKELVGTGVPTEARAYIGAPRDVRWYTGVDGSYLRLDIPSLKTHGDEGGIVNMMIRFNKDGHVLKTPYDFTLWERTPFDDLVGQNIYSMTDNKLKVWDYLIIPYGNPGHLHYLVNFDEGKLEYGEVLLSDVPLDYIDGMNNSFVYTIDHKYTVY
jgi:hypothetical protein